MNRYQKILGGLLAASLGDAMGAATETRSLRQIKDKFNGLVEDLVDIPDDVFARGFEKGSVTDDFSLAYETALAILDNDGVVNEKVANNALINWSKTRYYSLAGPTTVSCVNRMLGIESINNSSFLSYDSSKGSDGGAMKISPVGLLSKGDIDKAIEDCIVICKPTHFNTTALSGACAIASAVSACLKDDATVDSVIEAGLYGAKRGYDRALKENKELANPSVYKRIKLAVKIAEKYQDDFEACMIELEDIIGSGLSASETVPCAFGILKACGLDTFKAIKMGVNIGSDTDTIATIVGAMSGALSGYYDKHYLDIINKVNDYDLELLAKRIDE